MTTNIMVCIYQHATHMAYDFIYCDSGADADKVHPKGRLVGAQTWHVLSQSGNLWKTRPSSTHKCTYQETCPGSGAGMACGQAGLIHNNDVPSQHNQKSHCLHNGANSNSPALPPKHPCVQAMFVWRQQHCQCRAATAPNFQSSRRARLALQCPNWAPGS